MLFNPVNITRKIALPRCLIDFSCGCQFTTSPMNWWLDQTSGGHTHRIDFLDIM
jgi:hypothetical protein